MIESISEKNISTSIIFESHSLDVATISAATAVLDRKRRLLTGDILPSLSNSLLLLSSNIALDVYHKKTESWKDIDVRLFHTQLSAPSHIFFSTDNIGYVCIFLWWPKPIIDYHYWQWSVEEKKYLVITNTIVFRNM